MKETKEHLDIDLGFLDKKESVRAVPKSESNKNNESSSKTKSFTSKKHNWKNILIICGVILFFGWIVFSDDDSSSSVSNSNYTPSTASRILDNDNLMIGQYSCSRYHYDRAVALDPDETEQQIDNAQAAIESQTRNLENLKNEIDNSYVNDYSSQWEIDDYNEKVDRYNSLLPAYKRDLADLDTRIDDYNAQIQEHNNYLVANCTKKY